MGTELFDTDMTKVILRLKTQQDATQWEDDDDYDRDDRTINLRKRGGTRNVARKANVR
jgi:hypothetical protein